MREIKYLHQPGVVPDSLKQVPILQGLDSKLVDRVLADTVLLDCNTGDVIITEGDSSRFFCILLKGTVDVIKQGEKVASVDGSGELLGELAMLNEKERTATVMAASQVFCLKVKPDFLDGLSDADRNAFFAMLFRFVTGILSERLEQSNQRISELEAQIR